MSEHSSRLKNFSISWFSIVMGLAGFAIAWSKTESIFSLHTPSALGCSVSPSR
jgi:tellurite resistance protein